MRRGAAALTLSLVVFQSAVARQPTPPAGLTMMSIFGQFAVSRAVAARCLKPDDPRWVKFLANVQLVSAFTGLKLKEMEPDWPQERVDEMLKDRVAQVDRMVNAIVDQDGCGGAKVQEALRRFEAQADTEFKPPKAP